jgi:hypothetical protein
MINPEEWEETGDEKTWRKSIAGRRKNDCGKDPGEVAGSPACGGWKETNLRNLVLTALLKDLLGRS